MTITQELAQFGTQLRAEEIPQQVVEDLKLHLLDALAIASAAADLPTTEMVRKGVSRTFGGDETSTIPFGGKSSLVGSAFLLAALIHSLEFDDMHDESGTHPSAPIFGTAIPVAISKGRSVSEFIRASIVGFETISRLGASSIRGGFHKRGFLPTALCGTIASAMVASLLFGSDSRTVSNALSISGNMASGLAQSIKEGSAVKILSPGHAAMSGIFSAIMASEGFQSNDNILEGELGFYESFLGKGNFDPSRAVRDLGKTWETSKATFKKYPCGFEEHPFMDAAIQLRERTGVHPQEIVEMVYGDYPAAIIRASEPAAVKRRPPSSHQARVSRYFCISAAYIKRTPGLDTFSEEGIKDPVILDLAAKTKYVVDESRKRWVRIQTTKGETFEQRQDEMIPPTRDFIVEKALKNLEIRFKRDKAQEICDMILSIDKGKHSLKDLVIALSGPSS